MLWAANSFAADLSPEFIHAINQAETSGRTGAIYGDNHMALGGFQIHRECWKDAVEFDKSIGGKYEDCANYNYSVKILTAYLNRYAQRAVLTRDYKTLARIWNGGPHGNNNPETLKYWNKVKRFLKNQA